MRKLIVIGVAAESLLALCCSAAEWSRGTVIAKIIGPSQPTSDTVIAGYTNIFWTSIEIKETRRYFDPELVGTKLKILTSSFSDSLVGQTIPLEIIRTRTNSTINPEKLAHYRFQCCSLDSGYGMGRGDDETPHGVVIAKIIGPVNHTQQPPPATNEVAFSQWIEIYDSEHQDGSVIEYPWYYSQWVEIQIIEAKDSVAAAMKGKSINLKTLFGPEDRDFVGKTIPLEVCKSETANSATGYFTRGAFKTSLEWGGLIEEKRQQAAAAKRP